MVFQMERCGYNFDAAVDAAWQDGLEEHWNTQMAALASRYPSIGPGLAPVFVDLDGAPAAKISRIEQLVRTRQWPESEVVQFIEQYQTILIDGTRALADLLKTNHSECFNDLQPMPTAVPIPTAVPTPQPTPVPTVTPVPEPTATPTPRLDPFYTKQLDTDCLPVVSSDGVPDEALIQVQDVVAEMLVNRPDLCVTMDQHNQILAVMALDEVMTDMPGLSDLYTLWPDIDHNRRRGVAARPSPPYTRTTIMGVENVLCMEEDGLSTEDITVHEVAHTVFNYGVAKQPGGAQFARQFEDVYEAAMEAGLWEGTYAATNSQEYWAEGVQSWFNLNSPRDSRHNQVNTRAELEAYDPVLANLIGEVFGDAVVTTSCHEVYEPVAEYAVTGRVLGPEGNGLPSIGIWLWGGEDANNAYTQTRDDGRFTAWTKGGVFTLDVYAGGECGFIGWWNGEGITSVRADAAKVTVSGESIGEITIRLPAQPEDIPRIEWCA